MLQLILSRFIHTLDKMKSKSHIFVASILSACERRAEAQQEAHGPRRHFERLFKIKAQQTTITTTTTALDKLIYEASPSKQSHRNDA